MRFLDAGEEGFVPGRRTEGCIVCVCNLLTWIGVPGSPECVCLVGSDNFVPFTVFMCEVFVSGVIDILLLLWLLLRRSRAGCLSLIRNTLYFSLYLALLASQNSSGIACDCHYRIYGLFTKSVRFSAQTKHLHSVFLFLLITV